MQGGVPPVYGMLRPGTYGSFPQQGYGNGQFNQFINGCPVGQVGQIGQIGHNFMQGTIRPSSATGTATPTASPTKTNGNSLGGPSPGRAKTPTPVAQPVNTATQRPAHETSAVSQGVQQAQRGSAPNSARQRPATTSSLMTSPSSSGLQGAMPVGQSAGSIAGLQGALPPGQYVGSVHATLPPRGSASALAHTLPTQGLAPTLQTQATPVASHMRGGNSGGRRHWPVELWVVRHGETIENHTRTIAGQNASGLTERGHEQARLLSKRLENVKFAGIYISDLNRTKQTADAVLRTIASGAPAFTDSRLREKAAGKYEGQKIGYIEQMTRASGQPHRIFRPPGGESWEDVALRSRSFMREILARYCTTCNQNGRPLSLRICDSSGRTTPVSVGYIPQSNIEPEPKRVLIITHGGFISEFLSSAVGGVPNCAKNCSIFVLACARDHPQARAEFFLKTINDVSHVRNVFVVAYSWEFGSKLCFVLVV
jgi:broad specificity phosphatase PhoE